MLMIRFEHYFVDWFEPAETATFIRILIMCVKVGFNFFFISPRHATRIEIMTFRLQLLLL